VHLTGGYAPRFQAVFLAQTNSVKMALSCPSRQQVTQAVGQFIAGTDMSNQSNQSNSATILVAIIGVVGVIVTAYFSYKAGTAQLEIPIKATQTAEVRLTQIANFSIMTQPVISPSPTWMPLPTITETPTPTFTATATDIASTLLLQDDFINNKNGWQVRDLNGIESKIVGGKYIHSISCPPNYFTSYCEDRVVVPGLISRPRDLGLELDVAMKNVSPSTEVIIVFQFRRDYRDYNYYDVSFSSTGKYAVDIAYNRSQSKLLGDTAIPSFSPNTDTVNRYGFSVMNTVITPLFNGHELLSVEDGNISRGGLVYIGIFVSRGGSAVVELDNAIATVPSQ